MFAPDHELIRRVATSVSEWICAYKNADPLADARGYQSHVRRDWKPVSEVTVAQGAASLLTALSLPEHLVLAVAPTEHVRREIENLVLTKSREQHRWHGRHFRRLDALDLLPVDGNALVGVA